MVCSLVVWSYQSEDQVVESCGGQQEQQDGEQQRPDAKLEHHKHRNTQSKQLNLWENDDYSTLFKCVCVTWSRS